MHLESGIGVMRRTKAERSTLMQPNLLAAVLNELGDGVIVRRVDDGSVVFASDRAARLLGVSKRDLTTAPERWTSKVRAADRAAVRSALLLERTPRDGLQLRTASTDGKARSLEHRARRLECDGIELRMDVFRDVTAATEATDRLVEANRRLEELAMRDPLTGAWNRRGLEHLAAIEAQRARRCGQPVSAIFVDLDDFKAVNQRFGHANGDRVLCDTVKSIEQVLRPTDLVARIGGDEFLVLLPGAGVGEASRIAERVRRTIERGLRPFDATASFGVARIHEAETTVNGMLNQTQALLRRGKRAGKNRVVTAAA